MYYSEHVRHGSMVNFHIHSIYKVQYLHKYLFSSIPALGLLHKVLGEFKVASPGYMVKSVTVRHWLRLHLTLTRRWRFQSTAFLWYSIHNNQEHCTGQCYSIVWHDQYEICLKLP